MLDILDSNTYQVHLKGPGLSGRGVRFKLLSPKAKRASDSHAAASLPKDAGGADYFNARVYEGAKAFVCAVTEQHNLDTLFPAEGAPPVRWHDTNYTELTNPDPDNVWAFDGGRVFTPADVEILEAFYRQYHEPTQAVLTALLGEATPVA